MPIIQDNSEPTWTTAEGAVIKISGMTTAHIINAKKLIWERCRDNPLSQLWYKFRDLTKELMKRGFRFDATLEIAEKNCANLDRTYKKEDDFQYKFPQPPTEKFVPQKVVEAKNNAKERAEKEWQELEMQMLPEGDKHTLVIEDHYCEVHPTTRRIRIGALSDKTMPVMYNMPIGMNRKKVRITIEVLED